LRVVVTGGAGFIGGHLCRRLLERGDTVVCVDSFEPFYDPAVKRRTVQELRSFDGFRVVEADIRDAPALEAGVRGVLDAADAVVHLAARAGVRPSIDDPVAYADTNVAGTATVLELARRLGGAPVVFGSSSSVYGDSAPAPFREDDAAVCPVSPYAATKRAAELLCHAHTHLHGAAVAVLRFFTVYGPRQRPDLAIHRFARLMAAGEPVPLFGDGSSARDYTYVDDITDGIARAIGFAAAHPGRFEIFNLGGDEPVELSRMVDELARALGVEPVIRRLPPQPGDVERTWAELTRARTLLGYAPSVRFDEGIRRFVAWFRAAGVAVAP
jgi:UDP-glucuronate 4-epimerase